MLLYISLHSVWHSQIRGGDISEGDVVVAAEQFGQ